MPDVTASGVEGAVPVLFSWDWGIRAALAFWVEAAWGACELSIWGATFPVCKSLSSLEVDVSVGVETSIEASTSGGGFALSAIGFLADDVFGD